MGMIGKKGMKGTSKVMGMFYFAPLSHWGQKQLLRSTPGKAGVPANPGERGAHGSMSPPQLPGCTMLSPNHGQFCLPSFSPVMRTVTPPLGVRCM